MNLAENTSSLLSAGHFGSPRWQTGSPIASIRVIDQNSTKLDAKNGEDVTALIAANQITSRVPVVG